MEVLKQAWKRYVYTTVWKNTNIIWDHMYRTEGELTPIQLRMYLYEAGSEIAMLMINKFIAQAENLEYVWQRIDSTNQIDIIRRCILVRYKTKLGNHLNLEDRSVKITNLSQVLYKRISLIHKTYHCFSGKQIISYKYFGE